MITFSLYHISGGKSNTKGQKMEDNKILEMKLDSSYHRNENADNFFELNEITVTITLAEYRRLVADNAANEEKLSRYLNRKLTLEAENEELKERIKKLESGVDDGR